MVIQNEVQRRFDDERLRQPYRRRHISAVLRYSREEVERELRFKERREQIARAGGRLVGAAFQFVSIDELKRMLANDTDLFTEYSRRIRDVLNQPPELLKNGLQGLLASLVLDGAEIKVALSGGPLKEPVRMVFVPAPPDRLELPT